MHPPRPSAARKGFATLQLGQPPRPWRAFSRWDPDHVRKLTVMLSVAERDALAADIAGQVIEPGLWLLPAVALVLGFAIHRGLLPLRALAQEVHAARSAPAAEGASPGAAPGTGSPRWTRSTGWWTVTRPC